MQCISFLLILYGIFTETMYDLKAVNKYFWKYKWMLLLGILFVILTNVFAVYSPQIIRDALDHVTESLKQYDSLSDFSEQQGLKKMIDQGLLIFAITYLAAALLRGLFLFLMRQTIIVMSRHIEYDQKNELYAHYQKLTPAFYKRNNTGDLMSRVAEDVGRVRQYIGPALMYSINLVVLFILVIGSMLRVSPHLTFYVLLPLPVLSLSIYFVNRIIEKRSERIQVQLSHLTSLAQETFSGIRVIKAYTQERNTETQFSDACEEYKDRSLKLAKMDAFIQPLMILLIGLSTLITIFIGGLEVMKGNLTTGNVAEFIIYVNMLTWPVTSLGWVASIIQRAAVSQKRINEFLETKPEIISSGNIASEIKGNIIFDHVSFSYPDTGIQALNKINFEIKAGEKIAIIGRTGSGKTTTADLLLRLYDADSGAILFDGIPIKDYNLESLRKQISYVPQELFLFGDSVKNNISFGKPDISFEQIKQYAAFASIDKEIEQFKEGYDTVVGERGVTLSGGQKQRISIARAFIKNTPIIILDDCLSAVDANTEKIVLQNMQEYLLNKTTLIITHRIFALMNFDKIIVLDEHRIAETGSHDELLKKRGLYYDIYMAQQMEDAKTPVL